MTSLTVTTIGFTSAEPAIPRCMSPEVRAIALGVAVRPLALKVEGEPLRPADVTTTVFAPAAVPRVSTVAARPCASVATLVAESVSRDRFETSPNRGGFMSERSQLKTNGLEHGQVPFMGGEPGVDLFLRLTKLFSLQGSIFMERVLERLADACDLAWG